MTIRDELVKYTLWPERQREIAKGHSVHWKVSGEAKITVNIWFTADSDVGTTLGSQVSDTRMIFQLTLTYLQILLGLK